MTEDSRREQSHRLSHFEVASHARIHVKYASVAFLSEYILEARRLCMTRCLGTDNDSQWDTDPVFRALLARVEVLRSSYKADFHIRPAPC